MKDDKNIKKSSAAEREEQTLLFWNKNHIFEKTLEINAKNEKYVFYDGPPFATGLPHYGHILAGTLKDAIPRYQTMKGKYVSRRWGWDCHGLPIENIIEKELGLKTKKDIEEYGIQEFNQKASETVLRYAEDWKDIVPRLGRWVDMENDYRTMNASYTESVWWSFGELFRKNLIYKGFKSMHICPRCETTLSNFEVNQGYKDITDISIYAKFELVDEPDTFIVAWTTTPWTLPGNFALAVNPEIEYVVFQLIGEYGSEKYIVAKERLGHLKEVLKNPTIAIVKAVKGSDLIGRSYKPIFSYYVNADLPNKENVWKIYGAEFVTVEDGTGVVHIAPGYGDDDLKLSQKENIPLVQHVGMNGLFKSEVKDFAGQPVKPKGDHQAADIGIIKHLAGTGALFAKEKIIHSYPHCWRCETPLLNYAATSWFVKVTALKDSLVEVNRTVKWIPADIRDGRFGKWLEGARDWAISRSRYWGAPIPVWECSECDKREVLGSVEDIRVRTKSDNSFFVMRHGEAESNVKATINSRPDVSNPLTKKGIKQAEDGVSEIRKLKIDMIISSDLPRTKDTVKIVAKGLGLSDDKIVFDKRLREIDFGEYDSKTIAEYNQYWSSAEERFVKKLPGGESYSDVKERMGDFCYDVDKRYSGKRILVVSHSAPIWMMFAAARGASMAETIKMHTGDIYFLDNAEIKELNFAPIPHNRQYKLDLHRPYIDAIEFPCHCGGTMKRVPEVFDCWYESGSMIFAEKHYPFENKDVFDPMKDRGFPADFIAEGIDQTRGWFYSLLVLSTALFGKAPYKSVIVNGIALAEDGQKMSKSLKNYPDPLLVVNKYSADALRFYLLSSPIVKAESLNFSEKGVDEISKKVIARLTNVFTLYEMYKDDSVEPNSYSQNILDVWIVSKLNILVREVGVGMDNYELDRAVRPINDFIDDLSTWYIRRSRDRYKAESGDDRTASLAVTRYVLIELMKVIAPFMPFIAEDIYQKVKGKHGKESVHMETWPEFKDVNEVIITKMDEVRKIVSLGLEARARVGYKVRQPLQSISVRTHGSLKNETDFLELVKDEVNVKKVEFDESLTEEVKLDTTISAELKEEGLVREIVRLIQDFRKKQQLSPKDFIALKIVAPEEIKELFKKNRVALTHPTQVKDVIFDSSASGTEFTVDGMKIWVEIVG